MRPMGKPDGPSLIPPVARSVHFERGEFARIEKAAAVAEVGPMAWVEGAALDRLARVERAAGRPIEKGSKT